MRRGNLPGLGPDPDATPIEKLPVACGAASRCAARTANSASWMARASASSPSGGGGGGVLGEWWKLESPESNLDAFGGRAAASRSRAVAASRFRTAAASSSRVSRARAAVITSRARVSSLPRK